MKLMDVLKSLDIAKLEKTSRSVLECQIRDLKTTAAAYGIHWLMLGPLLSSEAQDRVCHLQLRSEFERISDWSDDSKFQIRQAHLGPLLQRFRERMGKTRPEVKEQLKQVLDKPDDVGVTEHYGRNASYANPKSRLIGSEDIALVHLTLHPGGVSDVHQHPGDELMLVLDGSVLVELPELGLCTELRRGDFIHFYAEQCHAAKCTGETTATVLVIRFLQLEELGARYTLHSDATSGDNWTNKEFVGRIRQEFLQMLMPFRLIDSNRQPGAEVVDRVGLARLLQAVAKSNGHSPEDLVRRACEIAPELKIDVGKINRLAAAKSPVLESLLPTMAHIYGTYPAVLFDYMHPIHRPVIQVRWSDDANGSGEWAMIPEVFVDSPAVTYKVPVRRLAHSDMSISYLSMKRGAKTDPNSHPGFELILPLAGSVTIEQKNKTHVLKYESHLYAHFASDEFHRVSNDDCDEAKLIVIRFYK